ncbi:MAG: septum site-determining protein MinD [Ardenticatenales bacterium]|jgi:septum site-determining protein MinD|nr:septum site-determining protein MinD [Ardenticatenales bacterium]
MDEQSQRAQVFTITSGKGGVGKTTTTANIGVALARRGRTVAVIDADIGLRNLDVVMGLENRVVYNLMHVVRGVVDAERALIRDKRVPGLLMLAADQHSDKDDVSQEEMVQVCEDLRAHVDYILVDSPAGIEQGFRNALAPADRVILVTTPEVSAVRDADRIVGLVEAAGKPAPVLILNRIKPDLVARGDMMSTADVLDILRVDILGVVPEDAGIVAATNRGEPVALDASSRAGRAFHNIAARIEGETVPLMALDEVEAKGFLKSLSNLFRAGPDGG